MYRAKTSSIYIVGINNIGQLKRRKMKRPLLIVTIAYIIGIIIGVYLKKSISLAFITIIIVGIIVIFIPLTKLIKNKCIIKIILISTIIVLISYSRVQYINNKYQEMYGLNQKIIEVVGTICDQVKETNYKYAVTIRLDEKHKNIKLIVYIDKQVDLQKLKYGNQISIAGKYSAPVGRRNYKGYNYREYLQTKGIYGTLEADKKISVIKTKNLNIINSLINKLSCKFKNNLDKLLSEKVSGLAKGILLGDSYSIDENVKENFQKCNLSHMLAVSGAHLSYLILGINAVLNKKILGIKQRKIICIIIIIIYMIITNMSPSVVRAGISTIIAICSTFIYRKQDTYTTMAIALLLTLINNPFTLFNIGLQLSYLATLSIVIFYSKISKYNKKEKIQKYILDNIMLTLSANILILPLIVYNFNIIPLNSILSNFIVGPILGICIILGFITLVVSLVGMPFAMIFAMVLNLLLDLVIIITNAISKIPFGNYIVVTPHVITIIVFYALILLYLTNFKNVNNRKQTESENCEKNNKKLTKNSAKILIICIVIIFAANQLISFINVNNLLKINFIDVGQGDSCLISTPKGKKILIDGGGNKNSDKYDVGEKVLLPYLLDRRIKTLDYIMISHFDDDHIRTGYLL